MKIVNVKNRTTEDFEFLHNGIPYMVPARQLVPMDEAVALHGRKKSMFKLDPHNNVCDFRLAVDGDHDCSDIELSVADKTELLDREAMGDTHARAFEFRNADAPRAPKKRKDTSVIHAG